MREPKHGTITEYMNYGCRCEPCRDANRQYRPSTPVAHGTRTAYIDHRCRCLDCKAANAAYHRERYRRRREFEKRMGWV